MSHVYTTELLIDDNKERHARFTNTARTNIILASKEDFASMVAFGRDNNEDHSSATTSPDEPPVVILLAPNGTSRDANVSITQVDFNRVQEHFHPGLRAFNPETDNDDTSDIVDEIPELQVVQDPVIYQRPETGLSQKNIPFFKFHNPNGKSAITISMTEVSYTRFDSLNDDTHQYVVGLNNRVEVRCVCTVNEQLGLEFRFRGTTHVISAEESNNVRLITESRDNPQ